ncbi:MAG: RecX family transcriptional regulator [Candidatus Saccharibacteria bacterium]
MPVITKISPQVKRDGYYNIHINGKYELSLTEKDLELFELKVDQRIDKNKLEELKSAQSKSKSYNFAIRFLALRPRSIMEVRQYLLVRKGFPAVDVDLAVDRLISQKYLNDYEFAEMWIRNRMLLKPKSDRALSAELMAKGIDRSIIDVAISDMGDDFKLNSLKEVITKKMRQLKYQDKQKLTEYLSRQGYNYSFIIKAYDELALFEN